MGGTWYYNGFSDVVVDPQWFERQVVWVRPPEVPHGEEFDIVVYRHRAYVPEPAATLGIQPAVLAPDPILGRGQDGVAEAGQTATLPSAAAPATVGEQLVTAVVQATLPLMLARVLTAIEEAAPEITRQVLADVAFAAFSSTEQG